MYNLARIFFGSSGFYFVTPAGKKGKKILDIKTNYI